MTKLLSLGMAVCLALAFAGSASAGSKHPARKHATQIPDRNQIVERAYGRDGYPTNFRIPAQPLVWDCVHVMFPQCGRRGYNNLNDGSYQ
jgi:hypothetical protein